MNTTHADRICYTLYTEDSVAQSLRTKGAVKSYQIVRKFLDEVAVGVTADNATLTLGLFETKRHGIAEAEHVRQLLSEKYGPVPHGASARWWQRLFRKRVEGFSEWKLAAADLEDTLTYIDRLGPLPRLEYRPPVSIAVSFDFWLKHPDIIVGDEDAKSSLTAFFSPSSNAVALTIMTPYTTVDKAFTTFRARLQEKCPVPLLDKHFYVQTSRNDGEVSYRRAYTSA